MLSLQKKQILLGVTIIGLVIFLISFSGTGGFSGTEVLRAYELREFILQFGVFGPIVFILLNVLTNIVAPLSGTPFFVASVFIYREWAAVYFLIASLLSFILNFAIAKIWGRSIVLKFVGEKNVHKIDKYSDTYGLAMLFTLRLSQIPIQDFLSYAAGLTTMGIRPYVIVSCLGLLPFSIVLFVVLRNFNTFTNFLYLYLAWAIGAFVIYGGLMYLKKHPKYKQLPVIRFFN